MENASKALVMAGSVLLAIMIISTLLYAASTWGILPQAQDDADAVEQLKAFNQQYESYNKMAIYGSDLVSVLNKAINNNRRYDETYYINITFTLNQPVEGIIEHYKMYYAGELKGTKSIDTSKNSNSKKVLNAKTYTLNSNLSAISDFINAFNDNHIVRTKETGNDDGGYYYTSTKTSVATSEFKTRVFQCTDIHYNSETGRVDSMTFVERDVDKDRQTMQKNNGIINT